MKESMINLIDRRISTPNNATLAFAEVLKDHDIKVTKELMKSYAIIEGKKYAIVITGSQHAKAECRQLSTECSGIITFWERNGGIYLIERGDLSSGVISRENHGNRFFSCTGLKLLADSFMFSSVGQVGIEEYRRAYMASAKRYADTILKECAKRVGI